jgi:hypothetical protein
MIIEKNLSIFQGRIPAVKEEKTKQLCKPCLKTHPILALCLFGLFVFGSVRPAASEKLEISASLDYCTDYVWRGLVINDKPVLQPSLTCSQEITNAGIFSLNFWGNYDLTDANGTKNRLSEIDYTASYALPNGLFGLEVGIIHYTFPVTTDEATTEAYIRAAYELDVVPLAFSLAVFYDFDEIDGFYLLGKVESSITPIPKLSLDLSFSTGYGDNAYVRGYFGSGEKSLFLDGVVSAVWTYTLSERISLSAGGQYMFLFNDPRRYGDSGSNSKKFTGTISLDYDF